MQYTSAQANKILKKLAEERERLLSLERAGKVFIAATTEDKESARPNYSYKDTKKALAKIEADIRVIKHAINVFNTTHFVEGFDLTVDQMLIYIPQLVERKHQLSQMTQALPKQRLTSNGRTNLIEYQYVNYDIDSVKQDYAAISEELSRAQVALDCLNNTETFSFSIE